METKRKGKRRNSDKRKEKSRDAARSRRSLETEVFSALASALPLSSAIAVQLDKASIMRLTIAHLKLRSLVSTATGDDTALVSKADDLEDRLHMRALSGFLFVVSAEGDFVFLSENIQEHLGIPQLELMGQSVYEFSHPCDHDELRSLLSERTARGQPCSFFLRLKSTLTSKGRSVNLKSASYKVIHCTGRALGAEPRCLVGIGAPIPHPSNIEVPLDRQAFLSKHSLDMRFTYADDKIGDFLGYSASDLIGKSIYEYFHAEDSSCVERDFKSLLAKGQRETARYRFLAAHGGYVWVVTQATLIHAAKGHKPISVVCVNYVISGIERQHEVYASHQLTASPPTTVAAPLPAPVAAPAGVPVCHPRPRTVTASLIRAAPPPPPPAKVAQPEPLPTYPRTVTAQLFTPRPQLATAKVFAPRTADMSKGFLMFADDDTGLTTLKDEPEDLTHLAPTAGDVCVPLMADLLDDFMLYGGSCGDVDTDSDVRGLTDASQEAMARGARDPFLSYRADETPPPTLSSVSSVSSLSSASHYLQAADLDRSPDASSLPSLCSPSPPDDRLLSEADEELSMRAPYIPMDEGDDLPLLVSDLMWGPLVPGEPPRASCLEELLCEDSKPASNRPSLEPLTPPMVSLDWAGCGPIPPDAGPGLGRESPGPGGGEGGTQRGKRGWPDPDPGGDVKRQRHSELRRHLTGTVTPPPTPPAAPNVTAAPSASVLMNLLVSGCDVGLGGMPRCLHKSPALLDPDTIMTLAALSARDCAVNAPLETHSRLLQGQDLLTALEATALE